MLKCSEIIVIFRWIVDKCFFIFYFNFTTNINKYNPHKQKLFGVHKYNPHKQKLFGVCDNFHSVQGPSEQKFEEQFPSEKLSHVFPSRHTHDYSVLQCL